MRELATILETLKSRKHMIRMSMFPGGYVSVAVYDSEKQMKQFIYESPDGDITKIVSSMKKDFPYLNSFPSIPKMPGLPAWK